MSGKNYDVIRGPDRDRPVGSGRAAIVDKPPWLGDAAKKDDPAPPEPDALVDEGSWCGRIAPDRM
ncbi:MAG TPA: hypothetical protein VJ735_17215 [Actinomycetes bacterium]|nr:hypothetical protein [Actinomycetes bacterium]